MKIAVLFASHRLGGKNREIEKALLKAKFNHVFDFIRLAEMDITPTLTPKNTNDDFDSILNILIDAEVLLLVVPVYCPYPAKFTALLERLLDDYVCKWEDDIPFKSSYISLKFKDIIDTNNMPEVHFCDLRHSSTTYKLKLIGCVLSRFRVTQDTQRHLTWLQRDIPM